MQQAIHSTPSAGLTSAINHVLHGNITSTDDGVMPIRELKHICEWL